jgi:DNA recombination protein RmuC
VDELNNVSQKIQAASDAHSEAMKKLATGKGNALGRARRLKGLGVSSKKELPVVLIGGENHVVEADDEDERVEPQETAVAGLLETPSGSPN